MIAKLVNGDDETLFQCTHVARRNLPGEGKVRVEICPSGEVFVLPDDGQVIFIQDGARTCDAIRPPVSKENRQ